MYAKSNLFGVLAVLAAGASVVTAHGHVMAWNINGQSLAGYNPSNPAEYGPTAQRPSDNSDQGFVPDITSGRVACGGVSAGSGLLTYPVDAGSTIQAVWNTWPASHKGPIIEYMAACPSGGCDGVDAASLSWFKIAEHDFNGVWPGEALASNLAWDIAIPADIASGPYLIRHEVIAMHSTGSPQVYPYCIQADIQGGGSAVPSGVNIIEAYNMNDDFKTFNVYNGDQTAFVAPGPAVYGGGGGSGGGGASSAPAPSSSTGAPTASAPGSSAPTSSASGSASSSAGGSTPTSSYSPPAEPTAAPSSSSAAGSSPASSRPAGTAQPSGQSSAATPSSAPSAPASGGGGSRDAQSCMNEMNQCKDKANKAGGDIAAAFAACDAQVAQCTRKRSVINRYSARSLPLVW